MPTTALRVMSPSGVHRLSTAGSCAGREKSGPDVLDLNKINCTVACTTERALLSSMLLRASYGGMACDVSLLQSACGCWLQRFKRVQEQQMPVAAKHSGVQASADLAAPTQVSAGRAEESPWNRLWRAAFCSEHLQAIPWVV